MGIRIHADRAHSLFSSGDLYNFLEQRTSAALEDVERYDAGALTASNPDELVDYFFKKHSLVTPKLGREEDIEQEQLETQVDVSHNPNFMPSLDGSPAVVPGTMFVLSLPFSGDADLFRYQPNIFGPLHPMAEISSTQLVFRYSEYNPEPTAILARLRQDLGLMNQWLGAIESQVAEYNRVLQGKIQERVTNRRQRLAAAKEASKSLPFKMKLREGMPATYAAPELRRKLAIQPPIPAKAKKADPEPTMLEEDYEHILSVCSNMALVLERSPKAFIGMEEEMLRSHFLVQLNGHYEGQATGETFNFEGKTDILVRSGNRNIFIAECKFWGGEKLLLETVDQILGYTSWRDTKTAILLFNRNKDFTAVLKKIPGVVHQHAQFKRDVPSYVRETASRYVFTHRDDPDRELTLTICAFNVPT